MELVIIQIIVAFIAIKVTKENDILIWSMYLLPLIGLLLAGLMIIIDILIIAEKKIKGERDERIFG